MPQENGGGFSRPAGEGPSGYAVISNPYPPYQDVSIHPLTGQMWDVMSGGYVGTHPDGGPGLTATQIEGGLVGGGTAARLEAAGGRANLFSAGAGAGTGPRAVRVSGPTAGGGGGDGGGAAGDFAEGLGLPTTAKGLGEATREFFEPKGPEGTVSVATTPEEEMADLTPWLIALLVAGGIYYVTTQK